MIKSILCINCICLPVCLNKNTSTIIEDCCFFKNTLINISASISKAESVCIYFRNLDREVTLKRSDADISTIYIQTNDHSRHILLWKGR
jgi:hypothetical protein